MERSETPNLELNVARKKKATGDWSLFDQAPSASPNHPSTGRRQNQEHKQVDTCTGKTQTTVTSHIHMHVCVHTAAPTHTFLPWTVLLCTAELRETALSGSPPPPPQAVARKHTYTEGTVCTTCLFVGWHEAILHLSHLKNTGVHANPILRFTQTMYGRIFYFLKEEK